MRSRLHFSIAFAAALHRFRHERKGSAAVEFAMIALPFLALLFAIFETAIVFFAQQALESATHETARMIMTGEAQMTKLTATQFKQQLCSRMLTILDCSGGVTLDVKSYSSFSSVSIPNPIDSSGNFTGSAGYNPGKAGDIVVVRTYYQWPLIVTGLGYDPSNLSGHKRLLISTAAFRNEPGTF